MRFIETLREGERISGVYFCKHKTIAVAKSGKEYGNVILQDKTGTLDGKIWDLGSAGIRPWIMWTSRAMSLFLTAHFSLT